MATRFTLTVLLIAIACTCIAGRILEEESPEKLDQEAYEHDDGYERKDSHKYFFKYGGGKGYGFGYGYGGKGYGGKGYGGKGYGGKGYRGKGYGGKGYGGKGSGYGGGKFGFAYDDEQIEEKS